MNSKEIISAQKTQRMKCVKAIISSKSNKKIIIAGAGTGKTYIFKEILKAHPDGNNIALTFINSLTKDMDSVLGDLAEVKTFHAYCKKILHKQNRKVDLYPYLTQIIEEDAGHLGLTLHDFDRKFQILDESSPEIAFYLQRGDYYDAVSFNDSVYRLYKKLLKKPGILPTFNQILIDEFQDFNPLEVAFINELETKGNVLIVGDDDQSVYEGRCASPNYLREKYSSGEYEIFELPYCGRCPKVIVDATNDLIYNAEKTGHLKGRVKKRFECYIGQKGHDSARFPKIHTARCTTGKVVAKYVDKVIQNIDSNDIAESWKEESKYVTVLITGPKQYLTIIQKALSDKYPQMSYKHIEQQNISVIDGYDILLNDARANLGWRILVDFYLERRKIIDIIRKSETGEQLPDVLNKEFMQHQERVVEIIRSIKQEQVFDKVELKKYTGVYYDEIIQYYSSKDKKEEEQIDKTKPSILLSSFVGCKGLSAGHVIIVGANDGSIPRNLNNIRDIEIAQFLVALTRTRKQCHIVSNKWLIAPVLNGVPQEVNNRTSFLDWITGEFIEDHGNLCASDI
jgi:superfamily I DNA/RNA helicase